MRKFIAGVIAGVLLFGLAFVFTDTVKSLTAAETGIYNIKKKDGTPVSEGVVIHGTVYAPVRAMADAVGCPLSVEGKTIIIEGSGKPPMIQTMASASSEEDQLLAEINSYKANIKTMKRVIDKLEEEKTKEGTPERLKDLQAILKKQYENLGANQAKVSVLEARLKKLKEERAANK